jgi:hypothetical protein
MPFFHLWQRWKQAPRKHKRGNYTSTRVPLSSHTKETLGCVLFLFLCRVLALMLLCVATYHVLLFYRTGQVLFGMLCYLIEPARYNLPLAWFFFVISASIYLVGPFAAHAHLCTFPDVLEPLRAGRTSALSRQTAPAQQEKTMTLLSLVQAVHLHDLSFISS